MRNQIKSFTNFLIENNLTTDKMRVFSKYEEILLERNQKFNLISKDSAKQVWTKHFLDSIIPLQMFEFEEKNIIDFGAGAGFPGIPIKILKPSLKLFLVESQRKKALFLRSLVELLQLENCEVINDRFEKLNEEKFSKVDFILVRAIKMSKMFYKKSIARLQQNGKLVLYKSNIDESELNLLDSLKTQIDINFYQKNVRELGKRKYIIIKKSTSS